MKPYKHNGSAPVKETNSTAEMIAMDQAFFERMKEAIEKGRERAPIGIRKDTSPFPARVIRAAALFSGMTSPAALCAEAVAEESRGMTFA